MFLLQARTPPGHEVLLLDRNAKPMTDAALVQFVQDEKIDLVGIGAMTRMIARAYRAADALRARPQTLQVAVRFPVLASPWSRSPTCPG